MVREIDALTSEEWKTLKRLERFAKANNLDLFDVKGSLFDRVRIITKDGGACPCLPKDRPFCPCPQAIGECTRNGECFCRLFLAKDWKQRTYKARSLVNYQAPRPPNNLNNSSVECRLMHP